MTVIISSSTAGSLNPGLDGGGGPVATGIARVSRRNLSTSLGNAFSAQCTYGWDQLAGDARVVLPTLSGEEGDALTIVMGLGNNVPRFQGTLLGFDERLYPHQVTASGKGPLYKLEEFFNGIQTISGDATRPGIALEDLVGAQSATLRQIVTAVLNMAGVSYTLGNLADPGHVYGLLAPEKFTWPTRTSAASWLNDVFKATAGYRLFDSADGNVYMTQVVAIPAVSPDFTFTLGKDIFGDSTSRRTIIGQRHAVLVEGYDDGSGPATSGIVGSGNAIFNVQSEMIEDDAFATEIANYWLPQVSRKQQLLKLSTPLDMLLGPAQTIFVDAASGLSVSDQMWLKSVTTSMASDGFTQDLTLVVAAA